MPSSVSSGGRNGTRRARRSLRHDARRRQGSRRPWRKTNKQDRKDHDLGQLPLAPTIQRHLDRILVQWNTLSLMPERTPTEIKVKKRRFVDLTESPDAWLLKQTVAIPIAPFCIPKIERNESRLIGDREFRSYWSEGHHPQGQAAAAAWEVALRKRFFHWFLEFPEIMARGGFDCILGNPPYLGRGGIRSAYGERFLHLCAMGVYSGRH